MFLQTDRLCITQFSPFDAAFLHELMNSPLWLQHIGDRKIHTPADALRHLEKNILPAYASNGLGAWRVALLSSNLPIGSCGFYQRDFLDCPDLGFAFLPNYLHQGYGYEAASACLEYGFKQLQLQRVCAITRPDNPASIRLLEKLGFVAAGATAWPDSEEELLLYRYSIS